MKHHAVLIGRVASGRGNASRHLAMSASELRTLLGADLIPGSLNVILNRPFRFDEDAALPFDDGRRLLWPATIRGTPVWLYRWRRAPLHIVEVLSTVRLREAFGLIDGEPVAITVSPERISAVSWVSTLAWSAFWLGRREWCYSNDRYYQRTARWCRRLGATQERPAGGRA